MHKQLTNKNHIWVLFFLTSALPLVYLMLGRECFPYDIC